MNDHVLAAIRKTAAVYGAQKVILFGSRARGDHSATSDYDIAVIDDRITMQDKARFSADIDEIPTLKKIDLVFLDGKTRKDFAKSVIKGGVVLYDRASDETVQL